MKKLVLLMVFTALLFSCVPSYLEEAAFLELPFGYEGEVAEWVADSSQIIWGVPDNGDDNGVYFGDVWSGIYYWENGNLNYVSMSNPDYNANSGTYYSRRIVSLDQKGWFVNLSDNGTSDDLNLAAIDFSTWATSSENAYGSSTYSEGLTMIEGSYSEIIWATRSGDPGMDWYTADISTPVINWNTVVLTIGDVSLTTDIIPAIFPDSTSIWGTATAEVLALWPSGWASYDGCHKYIIRRTDGISGRNIVVLVSIDSTTPSNFTFRPLEANSDFYVISQDRFVGMDGDVLKIFDQSGDLIKEYELVNMRLLGFRSSTERELVFLYVSDKKDGKRVCGIYSLPAAFIEEARQ